MYGAIIRKLRKSHRLTMKQLGEKINVAESTISGYENEDRKPDLETLQKLADIFDVSVDTILGRDTQYSSRTTGTTNADIKQFLENEATVMFNGIVLTEEDRSRVMAVMEALFLETNELNKKKTQKNDNF